MSLPDDYRLSTWTIFYHPLDFPGVEFVVREFYILRGREPQPAAVAVLCDTLEQAREVIPLDGVCIPRAPEDDPTIVETWL